MGPQRAAVSCEEKAVRLLPWRTVLGEFFAVQNMISWVALGFVLLVVLYPLTVILIDSFQEGGPVRVTGYSLKAWRLALSDRGIATAVWNTVALTIARQAIAFPVAILLAWVLARTDVPGARLVRISVLDRLFFCPRSRWLWVGYYCWTRIMAC